MTDKELLELAAKVAGIGTEYTISSRPIYHNGEPWNPLRDDGDALRLAVELKTRIESMASYCVAYSGSVCAKQFSERVIDADPCAATRRAIVRAAAEIGKLDADKTGEV